MTWQSFTLDNTGIDYGQAFTGDGSHLFRLGGAHGGAAVALVHAYDSVTDTWSARASMPAGRIGGLPCSAAGKIFYVGGVDSSFTPQNSVYAYDPADDAAGWSTLHALPFTVDYQGTAVGFDGKVYATTNNTGDGVYRYDPADDAAGWVAISAPPAAAPGDGQLVAASGTLFYIGGGYDYSVGATIDAAYSYDPATGWSAITAPPELGSQAAIGAGGDGLLWWVATSSTVSTFDPARPLAGWTVHGPPTPVSPSRETLLPIGDNLYFLEGYKTFSPVADGRLFPAPVTASTRVAVALFHPIGLDVVAGSTAVGVALTQVPRIVDLALGVVAGSTRVAAALPFAAAFAPQRAAGSTAVSVSVGAVAASRTKNLVPERVSGHTVAAMVTVHFVDLIPDTVYSQGDAQVDLAAAGGILGLDVAAGSTAVHLSGRITLGLDAARGVTAVSVRITSGGARRLALSRVAGSTAVRVLYLPDFSSTTPILLALSGAARLESAEPLVSA